MEDNNETPKRLEDCFPGGVVAEYGMQAASPNKDYYNLRISLSHFTLQFWRITFRNDAMKFRPPAPTKVAYEDFEFDKDFQRKIGDVFGKHILDYALRIVSGVGAKKEHCSKWMWNYDYLSRMPPTILHRIISFIQLEDIKRLSNTCSLFRNICQDDGLWMTLYWAKLGADISPEIHRLAAKNGGWKKLFFTDKLRLRRLLRREKLNDSASSTATNGCDDDIEKEDDSDNMVQHIINEFEMTDAKFVPPTPTVLSPRDIIAAEETPLVREYSLEVESVVSTARLDYHTLVDDIADDGSLPDYMSVPFAEPPIADTPHRI